MTPPPPPPRRIVKPPPPPMIAARRTSDRTSDWVVPFLIAIVALLLLTLFLIVIALWSTRGHSSIADGSGSASGSALESGKSVESQTSSEPTNHASSTPPDNLPPPPTKTHGSQSPATNTSRPQEPSGDTSSAIEQQHPIITGSKEEDNSSSVLGGSFFGIRAEGQRFVYVVDRSGSMGDIRYERAKTELIRSLAGLSRTQEFFVILYSDDSYPMFFPRKTTEFVKASDEAIEQVRDWVNGLGVNGGTNPEPALTKALRMKPDAVFFLTDGEIPASTADSVQRENGGKVTVHTIGFTNPASESVLREIADQSGGKYLFVP
jgi:von Willebrand factor type A domain